MRPILFDLNNWILKIKSYIRNWWYSYWPEELQSTWDMANVTSDKSEENLLLVVGIPISPGLHQVSYSVKSFYQELLPFLLAKLIGVIRVPLSKGSNQMSLCKGIFHWGGDGKTSFNPFLIITDISLLLFSLGVVITDNNVSVVAVLDVVVFEIFQIPRLPTDVRRQICLYNKICWR